ncbi:MAG TPA: hypothetical protein PKA41_16085 [Verrucomicrobiota bacterium]|nr:hypothetical protein [Verrucomicrobiota bacterium]
MSMTIDNLRVDHRVTVLRDFTDANGVTMRAGDNGVLRGLSWDQIRMEIHIVIERASGKLDLVFPLKAQTGPRNGHMREYFELGEDVSTPRVIPAFHDQSKRQMIVPPPEKTTALMNTSSWARIAQSTDGPDRLEDVEKEMLRSIDHIGVAASIAEIYAQRMRAFQRAGNEARAIAAFKLAVDWMGSYAASATSGGEGAALSYERDQFREALAREFGYDPTEDSRPPESHCQLP